MQIIPALFLLLLLPLFTARAQNADANKDTLIYATDEVVVTATRTEKKIIDIPAAVVRMNSSEYKFGRKTSIMDVLPLVPGVFMQPRYGNHDVRISIRGFGSRSNSGIRGVRILLDGIPESEPDGQTRIEAIDFNAVSNIEIVKGNSSSLYTNAPGGVINFVNNYDFNNSFVTVYNEVASGDVRRNGVKLGVNRNGSKLLLAYTYHSAKGFREHSEDYWHILNTVYEVRPDELSRFEVLCYFVDGLITLPGSLKKAEYEANPMQSAKSERDYNYSRVSKKGRVGLRYSTALDRARNTLLEVTAYGTIKYFERLTKSYNIMNRYGLGGSTRFIVKSELFERKNEFSLGGDLFYQTGPVESYTNIAGVKSDILNQLTDETISNAGFYLQNNYEILGDKLLFLISGRYDKVIFDQKDRTLSSRNDIRKFSAFTPKAALNYKFMPALAAFISFGLSFDVPAGNELDNFPTSSDPGKMINPDLQPQKSANFELGVKGQFFGAAESRLQHLLFDITLFHSIINDEIVPFEVAGSFFYRNAAKTNRTGIETGLTAELFDGFRARVAHTFSFFQYTNYSAMLVTLNPATGYVFTVKDLNGSLVPSIPKHNISAALEYRRRLHDSFTGFVKSHYQSATSMFADDANRTPVSGFDVVNTAAGFDYIRHGLNVTFSLGVNNLLNKQYVSFININSSNKAYYEAGQKRNFFGTFNFTFDL